MKRYISIFFLLLGTLLLFFFNSDASPARGVGKDTITIGGMGDMTGPAASQAMHAVRAWKNYSRHLNDQDGINGKKVKLKLEDDRYSIPATLAGFKKLVFRDRILALLGPLVTGGIVALTHQVQKHKVPDIVPNSAEQVINPPKRYIFNTGATYPDNMKLIFDYIMKNYKKPRIAYVYPDNEAGKAGYKAVRERAKYYKTKIVGAEVLNFGAVDATSQVLNLKRKKAEHIVIMGITSHAACLLRSSDKLALNAKFYGSTYTCDEDIISMAGKASRKFIGVQGFNSWYDDTPGMERLRKITLKYHPGTEKPYRLKLYVQGWVMIQIYEEAIKRAWNDLNGETLITALESFKNFETGLCPPLTYGPNIRKASDYQRLFKADYQKGRFIPITDWIKPGKLLIVNK